LRQCDWHHSSSSPTFVESKALAPGLYKKEIFARLKVRVIPWKEAPK
jgi:hypothetical protein